MSQPLILTRTQCREIDRRAIEQFGISGLVLMENAGRGLADTLCTLGIAGTVVICCGRGNNAGDGFVLARHLEYRGQRVKVLLWADPETLADDAAANYQIIDRAGIDCQVFRQEPATARLQKELQGAAWTVDALLGTGSRGNPRPPLDDVIETLNGSGVPIMAVDVPSGLDCDTGEPSPQTIRAAHTCTFVSLKPGFLAPTARPFVGELHVADIGVPSRLIEQLRDASSTSATRTEG